MSLIKTAQRNKEENKKPTRYYSNKQEKTVAKKFAGNQTKNSGATMFSKGDVKTDNILFECKTKMSDSESMIVKKEWLEKNKREALFMGKDYSVVVINFGPDQENYYILDETTFNEFVDFINNKSS